MYPSHVLCSAHRRRRRHVRTGATVAYEPSVVLPGLELLFDRVGVRLRLVYAIDETEVPRGSAAYAAFEEQFVQGMRGALDLRAQARGVRD